MTNKQVTSSDAVLVAIDIAKARNEVLIEFLGRQRRRKDAQLTCEIDKK